MQKGVFAHKKRTKPAEIRHFFDFFGVGIGRFAQILQHLRFLVIYIGDIPRSDTKQQQNPESQKSQKHRKKSFVPKPTKTPKKLLTQIIKTNRTSESEQIFTIHIFMCHNAQKLKINNGQAKFYKICERALIASKY